jgi:hypothetical protein
MMFRTVLIVVILCGLIAAPPAEATGLILHEFGTPDVGLVSTGCSARAYSIATLFEDLA